MRRKTIPGNVLQALLEDRRASGTAPAGLSEQVPAVGWLQGRAPSLERYTGPSKKRPGPAVRIFQSLTGKPSRRAVIVLRRRPVADGVSEAAMAAGTAIPQDAAATEGEELIQGVPVFSTATMLSMAAALTSGLFLYSVKHQTSILDVEIGKAFRGTQAAHARTSLLKVEWASLNDPVRLQGLTSQYLTLQPTVLSQFVQLSAMPKALPPPGASPADNGVGNDAALAFDIKVAAAVSEPVAAPKPADTDGASAAGDVHAVGAAVVPSGRMTSEPVFPADQAKAAVVTAQIPQQAVAGAPVPRPAPVQMVANPAPVPQSPLVSVADPPSVPPSASRRIASAAPMQRPILPQSVSPGPQAGSLQNYQDMAAKEPVPVPLTLPTAQMKSVDSGGSASEVPPSQAARHAAASKLATQRAAMLAQVVHRPAPSWMSPARAQGQGPRTSMLAKAELQNARPFRRTAMARTDWPRALPHGAILQQAQAHLPAGRTEPVPAWPWHNLVPAVSKVAHQLTLDQLMQRLASAGPVPAKSVHHVGVARSEAPHDLATGQASLDTAMARYERPHVAGLPPLRQAVAAIGSRPPHDPSVDPTPARYVSALAQKVREPMPEADTDADVPVRQQYAPAYRQAYANPYAAQYGSPYYGNPYPQPPYGGYYGNPYGGQ